MNMPSSPPTRAWERRGSTGSQYSLDLGALDVDSDDDRPLPKQKVERILSEDIDGPSDFTLNLDKWMRGGTLSKDTTRSAKTILQSLKETKEPETRADTPKQNLDVPQFPHRDDPQSEGEQTTSHHTPENSPPKESVWNEQQHDESDEHITSEWDPYTEASGGGTPQPPEHKQFLQPTVEDYYSELTPARFPSAARSHQSPAQVESPTEAHVSPQRYRSSSGGRPSSPTLSPVRSPVMTREAPSQQFPDQDLRQQMQQLQAKCQQLEHLNSALKQAVEEEQIIRKQEKTVNDMKLIEAARRERDLTEMKEGAYKRADEFRVEYGEQKERVRKLETEAANTKQEADRRDQNHREEIDMLRDDLEHQQAMHDEEIQSLKSELVSTRRARDDSEEVRVHQEELEVARDAHEAEVDRLRGELQKAESASLTIAELNAELKAAKDDMAGLREAKTNSENAAVDLGAELDRLQYDQDEATTMLASDHRRGVELAEKQQRQIRDLQQQVRDQRTGHEAEITRLNFTHVQAQTTTANELNEFREQMDNQANQSLLNNAILERDAAQDTLNAVQEAQDKLKAEFDALKSERDALKTKIETSEAVNAALDVKISESVRKRESYWRTRLEEGEAERKKMAKALMHAWGREELGAGSPQLYEYKFIKRGGSPAKAGAA